ncbi:MAG: TetR family transcriptional regulator [Jiangellales bacterium]
MRSGRSSGGARDDRTTRARIRDAAIEIVAVDGTAALTARRVADSVGVSPGSVIHHFGSMEGLRAACDEHVVALIKATKTDALGAGPGLDIVSALRDARIGPVTGYLAAVLGEDSPAVAQLVDDLVADAVEYAEAGVASGMLRPTADPHGRAALMVLWNLGGLVLHRHLHRLLGVDLLDPQALTSPGMARYVGPVYEIFGRGIFSDAMAASTDKAVSDLARSGEDSDD